MAAAARGARHGAVTIAVKDAMTTAGPCSEGDALGVVHGDFAIVGEDLYEVATGVLERLLGGGGELVTIVSGAEAGDLAQACEHWVGADPPGRRRRRLRGRSGALPGARGGGVAVAGVQVRWDSPVAAVGGKHYKKIVKATGVETVGDLLGIYPAPLRPQGVAERAGGAHTRATCSRWSARWSRRVQKPYQDRRTHRTAYRLEVRVRAEDGSLLLTYFDRHKHTAEWRANQELPVGSVGVFSGRLKWFNNQWQLTNPDSRMYGGQAQRASPRCPT